MGLPQQEKSIRANRLTKEKYFSFKEALSHKLNQILTDLLPNQSLDLFEQFSKNGNGHNSHPVKIVEGSCLEELPKLEDEFFDFIVTSPPYCNRYDYTRTYALELVYLGNNTDEVRSLRQAMLSCTVENKEKVDFLKQLYSSIGQARDYLKE